jgi:UPF0176 protein
MPGFVVLALYKFTPLPDADAVASELRAVCGRFGVLGTLILAEEGINGTIGGSRAAIDRVLAWLRSDPRFEGMEAKESFSEEAPFHRLKVLTKSEIVTMGSRDSDPHGRAGTHVDPRDWNAIVNDPDVVVVDCRNDFEVGVGTFPNAINPETGSFTEFPDFVASRLDPSRDRRIAMFCTGGIRCEKASSWMLDAGFETVYQLRGGVLRYLAEVPEEDSLWRGECFVFDRRVSLGHGLRMGTYRECHGCKAPVSEEARRSPLYETDVSCPACHDVLTETRREGLRERVRQIQFAASRGVSHLGPPDDDGNGKCPQ